MAGPVLLAALWKRFRGGDGAERHSRIHASQAGAFRRARAGELPRNGERWFPKGRAEVTGLPVREEFFAIPPKPRGEPFTILITGGSQGSRTLNRAAEESWPLWDKIAVRLDPSDRTAACIRRAGAEFQRVRACQGEIAAFLADMPAAFAEADWW